MIRKRNKDNIESSIISNNTDNGNTSLSLENKLFDKKTWKEQAIEVIEILKKERGINLYDDSTYPGMWLSNNKSSIPKVLLKNNLQDNNENLIIPKIFKQ